MSHGVRFYSHFNTADGYGLAALAYVRGLLNAGWPVHWVPMVSGDGEQVRLLQPTDALPRSDLLENDVALQDLAAIRAATSQPIDHATVLVQTPPELLPGLFEPGKKNVGYTTWEADALPPHWKPRLDQADLICVPCQMNLRVFSAGYLRPPVHVVPHIRRHAWNEFAESELQAMRASLGIPQDHFIFYSISSWEPRKNQPALLQSYLRAFTADSPVTLILKTLPEGYGAAPFYPKESTSQLASAAMADAADDGRSPPQVCLLPYELSGRGIDMLHALGDCYISASCGEGWALGAFDAATRGTPVVMTGWGGQLDYLGADWPGAIPFKMRTVPVWPVSAPSFWPPQRWADPMFDDMVSAWQNAVTHSDKHRAVAQKIAVDIANRFAEPVVTAQLSSLLQA